MSKKVYEDIADDLITESIPQLQNLCSEKGVQQALNEAHTLEQIETIYEWTPSHLTSLVRTKLENELKKSQYSIIDLGRRSLSCSLGLRELIIVEIERRSSQWLSEKPSLEEIGELIGYVQPDLKKTLLDIYTSKILWNADQLFSDEPSRFFLLFEKCPPQLERLLRMSFLKYIASATSLDILENIVKCERIPPEFMACTKAQYSLLIHRLLRDNAEKQSLRSDLNSIYKKAHFLLKPHILNVVMKYASGEFTPEE